MASSRGPRLNALVTGAVGAFLLILALGAAVVVSGQIRISHLAEKTHARVEDGRGGEGASPALARRLERIARIAGTVQTAALVTLGGMVALALVGLWLARRRVLQPLERAVGLLARAARGERPAVPAARDGQSPATVAEVAAVHDATARLVELLGAYEAERARAEATHDQLRRSEAKYRGVIETAAQGFWMIDLKSLRTVDVNGALCALLGYDRDTFLGARLSAFVEPGSREVAEAHERALAAGEAGGLELPFRAADGRTVHTRLATGLLAPADGGDGTDGSAAVALVTDITESIERERRLQNALADMERFASVASHDLQEPLRRIISYTQLLQHRYGAQLDDDAQAFAGYAVAGARRALQLVRDLALYTDVDRADLPRRAVTLESLVRTVAAEYRDTVAAEGGRLDVHGPLPEVRGDPTLLRRVLDNLIGNAVKYRHPERPPEISVSAAREGAMWRLTVADNGIGIDPRHTGDLFIIFKRLHSADDDTGTGVGLALCKKIVEHHGGRIRVDSHPDSGSRFHFTLPAVDTNGGTA